MKKCLDIAMAKCFWCGEANGVLIGKKLINCENKLETNYVFVGYEPCDKCKEKMSLGLTVIIVQKTEAREGQPEIEEGVYPTGAWFVLSKDSEIAKSIGTDICFMERESAKEIGLINDEN